MPKRIEKIIYQLKKELVKDLELKDDDSRDYTNIELIKRAYYEKELFTNTSVYK